MRIRNTLIWAALAAAVAGGVLWVHAATRTDDSTAAQVQQALTRYVGNRAEVGEVRPSELPGLYEAVVGSDIVYTDRTGRYIVTGDLIDTREGVNLSDARRASLEGIDWADLPLQMALKTTHGNGLRSLAVFADPNCGHCKRLEKELRKLDNVTIYTFIFPFLSADSVAKASGHPVRSAAGRRVA